jgi:hypothetical protein
MLWLALLLALPCGGQIAQQQQIPNGAQGPGRPMRQSIPGADQGLAGDLGDPIYNERRLRQLNEAQHNAMVSDTDKLLRLVTDLSAQINSTNPSSLTSEQLRKVAEIEKLARSVKDKMRTSVKGAPVFLDATPPAPLPLSRH